MNKWNLLTTFHTINWKKKFRKQKELQRMTWFLVKSLMIFLQSIKLLYSRCICNSDLVFRSTSIRVSISTIILLRTRRSSCSSSGGGIVWVNAPVTCLKSQKQHSKICYTTNFWVYASNKLMFLHSFINQYQFNFCSSMIAYISDCSLMPNSQARWIDLAHTWPHNLLSLYTLTVFFKKTIFLRKMGER